MSSPVVALDAIPTAGLSVELRGWAMVACGEGLGGAATQVDGQFVLTRVAKRIVAKGELTGRATVPCDRCAAPLELAVAGELDFVYAPALEIVASARAEEDPTADVPDEGEYDGVAIELAHVVREFFALERPLRTLCADLSTEADADAACHARFRALAHLAEPAPDARFAVLKRLTPTH